LKKFYIETYGCQMNEYDSEIVTSILKSDNYTAVDNPEDAQLIFLNTCSVRENAHSKVFQRINVLKGLKKKNKALLGVLGCMAQSLRKDLLENGIAVDLIAGPDSYRKLPAMIQKLDEKGGKDFALSLSDYETYSDIFPEHNAGVNAWIAVMRGCNNFCSFCVVPYSRGRERSRNPQNIVQEAQKLADQGFKQITLLGQNVNSYNYNEADFAALLDMVRKIDGIDRVRFTSPHPKDFPEQLLEVIAENPKACKHIHLPIQAGNDRVLNLMNRTYSGEEYLALVNKIRRLMPDISLTTDIIVGFPSETEEEFQDTLELMRDVKFDAAFMFKYSERPHTIASRKYPDDVSEEDKTSRITRLVDQQRLISIEQMQRFVNRTVYVLVEGRAKKPGQLMGRTDGNQIAVFPDNGAKAGEFVQVKIVEATANTLIGTAAN